MRWDLRYVNKTTKLMSADLLSKKIKQRLSINVNFIALLA